MRTRVKRDIKKYIADFVNNNQPDSPYYRFGLEKFGPFLYGYTKWLFESISASGTNQVFFFSRDGFMMKKAFDVLAENSSITSSYVYFSRKSIRQAMLHRLDSYSDSLRYLTWERYITIGKLLEYYGFSESRRSEIAAELAFDLEENVAFESLKENVKLQELYQRLKPSIDSFSKEQDFLLKKYLKQIGMIGKCAIVDIGWHGSMQYFLEEYCRMNELDVEFYGYYIGIKSERTIRGQLNGFLYDQENSTMRKDLLCFFGGYEKLFQSSEGSTYGYVEANGKAYPQLASYEYENDDEFVKHIMEWQNGAMDFVYYMLHSRITVQDPKEWAFPLVNFGKNPSLKGIALFRNFYNTDGTRSYYVAQKPIFRYRPREFKLALSNSEWKTGFMKSALKIPFPYFGIYCLLRK